MSVTTPVTTPVPFLDLRPVHGRIETEVLDEFAALLRTGAFTNGAQVAAFERAFADYCGTPFCVGMASGLDALRLGLLAAGIQGGDEVLVPANTFVATFEAVTQAGGRPVVVDVSEHDYNMDVPAAAAAVTDRTRFAMPVHLYGQLADMDALARLSERARFEIVEDACQAHGATRDGRAAGRTGIAGAFSFYPGKNLGAFGDAGALVTRDEELAAAARSLREHGQRHKYVHDVEGYTARLDTIQAIVLEKKLAFLDHDNGLRRAAAAFYLEALDDVGDLVLPPVPDGSEPVWHLFVVRTPSRDALAAALDARRVSTGLHYPQPPHLSAAYAWLGHRAGDFPVAERLAREVLSLPIFPGITEEQLSAVVDAVRAFYATGGRAAS